MTEFDDEIAELNARVVVDDLVALVARLRPIVETFERRIELRRSGGRGLSRNESVIVDALVDGITDAAEAAAQLRGGD